MTCVLCGKLDRRMEGQDMRLFTYGKGVSPSCNFAGGLFVYAPRAIMFCKEFVRNIP